MSATGTYTPSIWQEELPKCSLAMSLRPGSSTHCDDVTAVLTPRVAPHAGQLSRLPSTTARHHEQFFDPLDGRGACGAAAVIAWACACTCGTDCGAAGVYAGACGAAACGTAAG